MDYLSTLVSHDDRDRFLAAQFAPPAVRGDVLALYAFNIEVARIRESVSETLVGAMKLQWWRDLIATIYERGAAPSAEAMAGTPLKGNPVVEALASAIFRHNLTRAYFDSLFDARARDLEEDPPVDVPDLETYAAGTSASLAWLVLETLGVRDEASRAAGRHVGIAWALTGLLRAVLYHARVNRFLLPADLMAKAALTTHDVKERKNAERIAGVVAEIASVAKAHLAKARALRAGVDRRALPALLPAVLADGYLAALSRHKFDVFDPRHGLQRPAVARLIWNGLLKRY
ncbi:MAG: squalene/phytoene synthase family protein [Rhodospirillaceae bacterium]|nr:squalene/phytoene synthase family protein [Rhodospirillaceae bacterium]